VVSLISEGATGFSLCSFRAGAGRTWHTSGSIQQKGLHDSLGGDKWMFLKQITG
jgi:hypothetical protein